ALLVTGLVLVAEDPDLVAAEVLDLLGGDLDLRELVLGGGDLVAVDQQHGSEIDAVARLACHAVDHDGVTDRHLLLTTACADDCVHHVNAPSCDSELLYESSSLPGVTADLRPSTWSGPRPEREMRSAMSTGSTTATRSAPGNSLRSRDLPVNHRTRSDLRERGHTL